MDVLLATNALPEVRESFDNAAPAPKPAVTAVALLWLLVKLVVSIGIGVLAVRLNWRCNRNVFYAILSWLFSVPYLLYRALFGRPCF